MEVFEYVQFGSVTGRTSQSDGDQRGMQIIKSSKAVLMGLMVPSIFLLEAVCLPHYFALKEKV